MADNDLDVQEHESGDEQHPEREPIPWSELLQLAAFVAGTQDSAKIVLILALILILRQLAS
ncbi:hypothetical protein [Pseudonocardia sp. D17]|uniref:hypothetical protein n=1 Tax=Pseudonocardia sp. D17 TaxID=882661 RepID=UPI002B3D6209|nr:hypothetical protein PSD17_10150 [Pseudonocardia sp. D17]